MLNIKRTNATDNDFALLVQRLDQSLKVLDGEDHAFYSQYNKLDKIKHVLLAYSDGKPVGCGAIKHYAHDCMEVKRMYVDPSHRGRGIATAILSDLEHWATELGYTRCILETGVNQPEAIGLHKKKGYIIVPNYGQYATVENSFCFDKVLCETHSILLDVKIKASRERVFEAVSEATHLENWWPLRCSGSPRLRAEYNFFFSEVYDWKAIVSEVNPNHSIHYKMTKSDEDWQHTLFGFELSEDEGTTLVKFAHHRWPKRNHHFRFSAYCWALLLKGLKSYVEKGEVIPFPERS